MHAVDTCGDVALVDLDFQSENRIAGLEYQSHHPRLLRAFLEGLSLDYEKYSFVDFGCGKGRVLLVASEFPFRRIVGVEFAVPLAEVAKRNVLRYRSRRQKCRDIAVAAMDAVQYKLPEEPEVLYFYSPFPPAVMEQVFQNIESSLRECPRDLYVLFSGVLSARDRAFGCRPQYERLRREQHVDVYRRRPNP
ncbi:MAG TPA: class I SAM-dependent methyltransferase [Candidatus Sulfotelmatobacter sp.]